MQNKKTRGSRRGERRVYPRADKVLPLRLNARGFDIFASTKNLSCIGAYCQIDRYIPSLTKLSIIISFAGQDVIKCWGVVVRVDGIYGSSSYNIAIYFNEISDRDKNRINNLIVGNGHAYDNTGGHIR